MPHLRYRDAAGQTVSLDLRAAAVTIGRQPECEAMIPKQYVSRKHARIEPRDQEWWLVDLDSTHGTFVNRNRVKEALLRPGDQIHVGGQQLVEFVDGPAPNGESVFVRTSPGADPTAETTGALLISELQILTEHSVDSSGLMDAWLHSRASGLTDPGSSEPLDVLLKIAEQITRATEIEAVCRVALDLSMKATSAVRGVLALADEQQEFVPVVQRDANGERNFPSRSIKISRTFTKRMVDKRVGLLAQDTGLDDVLAKSPSIAMEGIRSIVSAPLFDGERLVGYLYLDSTGARPPFQARDLDLVCAVARHTGEEIARRQAQERAGGPG